MSLFNWMYSIFKYVVLAFVLAFMFVLLVVVPGLITFFVLTALVLSFSSGLSVESLYDFLIASPLSENHLFIMLVVMAGYVNCSFFCAFIQEPKGSREEDVNSEVVNNEAV